MTSIRNNPLFIIAVLALLIVLAEHLVRRGGFRHVGTALLVIIFGAIASNLGVIPSTSTEQAPVPVYDAVFAYVAPIALFWLLLQVNLRSVLKAGLPLIALFFVGAAGTMLGVVVGMRAVNGAVSLGDLYRPIAGMFTGTYIGGSVNFNALALEYRVMQDGLLYGGSTAVDNIVTASWIAVTLAIPRLLGGFWVARRTANPDARRVANAPLLDVASESETLDPRKLALVVALGVGALWASQLLKPALDGVAARLAGEEAVSIPLILIVTTVALVLAQIPRISALPGPRAMGMFGVYLFVAVIGAFCDLRAMAGLGSTGAALLGLATVIVLVHGALIFGVAWLFRMDLQSAAVASQANIGGSSTAVALAKSFGREDLLLPGILLGALGNAIGTFLGLVVMGLV